MEKKSWNPIWEKNHRHGWGRYPFEDMVRFLSRYRRGVSDFKKKNRILDLGCGEGANTKVMVDLKFKTAAIDGSAAAIRHARQWVGSRKVDFKTMDFLDLDKNFPAGYFDLVCDNVAMYANTLSNIQAILKKIAYVLKPGGKFYCVSFSSRTTGFGRGKRLEKNTYARVPLGPLKNGGITHFFTENEIRKLWSKFFKIESIDRLAYTQFNKKENVDLIICVASKI